MWAAAPQLAFVLLSARVGDIAPGSQNVLAIIPFVFAGAVYALSRNPTSRWRPEHVLVASLGCCLFMGPLNPVLFPSVSLRHVAAERRAVALVPRTAAVSVTNHLGSHLAARRFLYVFPVIGRATWIVVDKQDQDLPDMRWLRTRHGTEVGVVDLPMQPGLMRRELRKLSPRARTLPGLQRRVVGQGQHRLAR